MKKTILIVMLIFCQNCTSISSYLEKDTEIIKVELFDFENKPFDGDNFAYGRINSKDKIHKNFNLPIKPRIAQNTDDILIFNQTCPFFKEDVKIKEVVPYIKFKNNKYININGLHGFVNYYGYVKITNPGKKYSLIILSEEKFEIKSRKGQFTGDFGIANSIIDAGGRYYDKNNQRFKIFVINEKNLAKNFFSDCDAEHLKRNKLKKIFKENNIETDVKKIKVEQIVEFFDKINNG